MVARFISYHDADGVTLDTLEEYRLRVNELARAKPDVIYYRSWVNLGEGKIMCECDAPDAASLKRWFDDLKLPAKEITEVDLIGQAGMTTLAP